jgi:hypothetical protein
MTEAELAQNVKDLAHRLGWEVFALPIAKTRRPVKDAVGYPDLTLARRNTVIFMELKTEKGFVTDDQWRWGIALPEWHVIRPADWDDGRVAEMLR